MSILKEKVGLSNSDLTKLRSMRPGAALDIQVASPTGTKRVRTEFVGMDGTRALIFRFPDESKWGNMRDCIYQDNSVIIRYIVEGNTGEIIAFKVKISLILTKPSHLVFTSFPLALQAQGLRSEQRAQTCIAAELCNDQNQLLADVTIVDISLSGCRLSIAKGQLKQKASAKQAIVLKLNKPNGESVNIAGLIMNTKTDDTNYYFGIKFDSSEQVIEELLNQLMISVE